MSIERGTVVAGRYVVSEKLRPWLVQFPERGSILLALDAILDSPVIVYVSPVEYSGNLLDAGRRSALLSDPRIPAILDVGNWNGYDYVVCERSGGTSLARLLRNGPLDPETARAVVGELATALTHAANRGLHHGILGPESVAVTPDCDVIVRGVAIDAAIADEPLGLGMSAKNSTQAKRSDALSLVNLLYACLSAHWPGSEGRAGLPASGRKNNRVVALDELVDTSAIPSDLDIFASNVVTGVEPGPRSPSEIVRYLDSWDTSLLENLDHTARTEDELFAEPSPMTAAPAATTPTATEAVDTPVSTASSKVRTAPSSRSPLFPAEHRSRASQEQLQAALAKVGLTRPGTYGLSAGVQGTRSFEYDERMQMRRASTFPIAADQLDPNAEWPDLEAHNTVTDYDPNATNPLLNRDAFESDSRAQAEDSGGTQHSTTGRNYPSDDDTSSQEIFSDDADDSDDDGSWFLGGMFQTHEQQLAAERAEFERERRLQYEARKRLEAKQDQTNASSASAGGGTGSGVHANPASTNTSSASASAQSGSPLPRVRTAFVSAQSSSPTIDAATDTPSASASHTSGKSVLAADSSAKAGVTARSAWQLDSSSDSGVATQSKDSHANSVIYPDDQGKSADPGTRRKVLPFLFGAAALIAAIVLGSFVFLRPGTETQEAGPGATDVTAQPTTNPETPEASEEPAAELTQVDISRVNALDPEGDGAENNSSAKNVLPGAKGAWESDRYNSATFGSLKSGLGLDLELKKAAAVKEVIVESTATGGSFDVYVGDSDDIKAAQKIGSGAFKKDKDTTITVDEAVEGSHVIIWVTELPKKGQGFRASISKITIKA